ncbi:hypothetical protein PENTCL1PPCAC_9099, partial [Pristionchus entomophagus]
MSVASRSKDEFPRPRRESRAPHFNQASTGLSGRSQPQQSHTATHCTTTPKSKTRENKETGEMEKRPPKPSKPRRSLGLSQPQPSDSYHLTTSTPGAITPNGVRIRIQRSTSKGMRTTKDTETDEQKEITSSASRISDPFHASSSSPHSSTSMPDEFERIMRRAKELADPNYKEPPLPVPHHPAIVATRERMNRKPKKLVRRQDTTQGCEVRH